MRTVLFLALAGCSSENDLIDLCDRVDEFVLCHREVTFSEADESCGQRGGWLVDVTLPGSTSQVDVEQWERLYPLAAGVLLDPDVVFWTGWPADWDCPAMNWTGTAVAGHSCDDLFPFVCELETL
jgi:hypothetical protein